MPGLVYVSGIWLGNQKFRLSVAANMCLIALGVVVCGLGEENLVLHGLAKQLTALMFEATRLAMIEILINRKGMKMDPLQSLYYVCPACFCALAVPFYFVEYEEVAAVVLVGGPPRPGRAGGRRGAPPPPPRRGAGARGGRARRGAAYRVEAIRCAKQCIPVSYTHLTLPTKA